MFNGVDSRDANYEISGRLRLGARSAFASATFAQSSCIDLQAFASLEQEIEQDASSLSRTLDDAQEIEQDGTGYRAGTREVEGAHRAG